MAGREPGLLSLLAAVERLQSGTHRLAGIAARVQPQHHGAHRHGREADADDGKVMPLKMALLLCSSWLFLLLGMERQRDIGRCAPVQGFAWED